MKREFSAHAHFFFVCLFAFISQKYGAGNERASWRYAYFLALAVADSLAWLAHCGLGVLAGLGCLRLPDVDEVATVLVVIIESLF